MKILYVYNNRRRKTPLIKTPDTKEARELYQKKGYKIEAHTINLLHQIMNPIQAEMERRDLNARKNK